MVQGNKHSDTHTYSYLHNITLVFESSIVMENIQIEWNVEWIIPSWMDASLTDMPESVLQETTDYGVTEIALDTSRLMANSSYSITANYRLPENGATINLEASFSTPLELSIGQLQLQPNWAIPAVTDCSLSITSWTFDEGLNFEIWFIY